MNHGLDTLFWEATLRCNAYCSFCGSRCGDVFSDELATDEIKSVFTKIAHRYDPSGIMINVTGGEPLTRSDLFEVMSLCRDLGYHWGMVSNGMLIDEDKVNQMKESGMKTVSISIDGIGSTHDSLRGVAGGFDKALHGIKLLKNAAFLDHLQITTVVSRKNIGELEELYDLVVSLEVDSWRVALVDPIGRAHDSEDLLLGKNELEKFIDFIISHQNGSVAVETSCSHYFGRFEGSIRRTPFVCRTGVNVASILANGDIFVCPNVERRPELIQGNVKKDDFCQVWESGFRTFRKNSVRLSKKCETCPEWIYCRGDSMHTWDFDNNQARFCILEQLGSEAAQIHPDLLNESSGFSDFIRILRRDISDMVGINFSGGENSEAQVVFTPSAAEELYSYFHWGENHPLNMDELMSAIFGHIIKRDGEPACYVAEFVCPLYIANRNEDGAEFTKETHLRAMEELAIVRKRYIQADGKYRIFDEPCRLIGYIHSHPQALSVGVSEGDAALHKELCHSGISDVSVILNPQKRDILSYLGEKCACVDTVILMPENKLDDWRVVSE